MEIKAFKAFKSDLTNKYGQKFELAKKYMNPNQNLKFGSYGTKDNGFHMASSLPDTFRFFNPTLDNIYCEVEGSGKIITVDNYYYDSAPMYVAETMEIKKILTRDDIIEMAYNASTEELSRYIALFPFTQDELITLRKILLEKDKNLWNRAKRIQTGDITTFKRNKKYLQRTKI